jgi:hypothetical protein
MVITHATVAAEAGHHVTTLIDDEGGRRMAALEAERLERLRRAGTTVGSVRLISTVSVLKKAGCGIHLPGLNAMRDLYGRLRSLDKGLMNLPCRP